MSQRRCLNGRADAQSIGVQLEQSAQSETLKKIPETDALFANVREARARASEDPTCLSISWDVKAKVKIGPLSRGGRSRNRIKALDHDFQPEAVLVPLGILEIARGDEAISQLNVLFGQSRETSDFLVDGLERWWQHRAVAHPPIRISGSHEIADPSG